MQRVNRRSFLRTGVTGAAAVIAGSSAGAFTPSSSGVSANIVTRDFGATGLRLPVVSMGVMNADNPALVRAALDKGIVHFDTANGYQGGRNETMLGEIFSDYPRESFVLATKVRPAGMERRTGNPTEATTAEAFLADFEVSMGRLKMDYVDILYVHSVSSKDMVNHPGITRAVQGLKKEGRVKFIGISTHSNEPAVIDAMVDAGIWDVVLVRYNYTLAYLEDLNRAIARAAASGMAVVAMKTMAGGWLDRERTKPVNTRAALRWTISNPDIHTTIPGMTTFDQLDDNLVVLADPELNDEDRNNLTASAGNPGLFCTTCNSCLEVCSKSLPVPDLMRAYMYAYGYVNNEKAYSLLSDLGTGIDPCSDCSDCTVNCTNNFNVREKIADISRLSAVPADFIV
jgi:predicted aldo/keto reductase-like oxidoreductase